MASESSDEDVENWVFYRDREEWRDVVPVEQDDGPFPVVAIAYTEKCKLINSLTVMKTARYRVTTIGVNLSIVSPKGGREGNNTERYLS